VLFTDGAANLGDAIGFKQLTGPISQVKQFYAGRPRPAGRLPGNQPWSMFIGDLKKY
jgi:hypothetical protein